MEKSHIEKFIKNININKKKLTNIDKIISESSIFLETLNSPEFTSFDEFLKFIETIKKYLIMCPDNEIGINGLPIDPITKLEISPENITIKNNICFNNTNTNISKKWFYLVPLFLASLSYFTRSNNQYGKIHYNEIESLDKHKTVQSSFPICNPYYHIKYDCRDDDTNYLGIVD